MGYSITKLILEPIDPQVGCLLDMIVDADESVLQLHANFPLSIFTAETPRPSPLCGESSDSLTRFFKSIWLISSRQDGVDLVQPHGVLILHLAPVRCRHAFEHALNLAPGMRVVRRHVRKIRLPHDVVDAD